MKTYIHKVNYYETDKMGISHHSNYIRWMEEARIDFLDQIGYGYAKLENDGIMSPVIGVECEYKKTTTFDDEIEIEVKMKELKGVRFTIEYIMKNAKTGELVAIGRTKHCFVNNAGKPIILKKEFPELDEKLKNLILEY